MKQTTLLSYDEYKFIEKLYNLGTCIESFRFKIFETEEYRFIAIYAFMPMNVSITIEVYRLEDGCTRKDYTAVEMRSKISSEEQYKEVLSSVLCKLGNTFINEKGRVERLMNNISKIVEAQV